MIVKIAIKRLVGELRSLPPLNDSKSWIRLHFRSIAFNTKRERRLSGVIRVKIELLMHGRSIRINCSSAEYPQHHLLLSV
jgi:hypothetical protein